MGHMERYIIHYYVNYKPGTWWGIRYPRNANMQSLLFLFKAPTATVFFNVKGIHKNRGTKEKAKWVSNFWVRVAKFDDSHGLHKNHVVSSSLWSDSEAYPSTLLSN